MDLTLGAGELADRRVDVVTEGGYIAIGTEIEVVADEGYRRVVRSVSMVGPSAPDGELGHEC